MDHFSHTKLDHFRPQIHLKLLSALDLSFFLKSALQQDLALPFLVRAAIIALFLPTVYLLLVQLSLSSILLLPQYIPTTSHFFHIITSSHHHYRQHRFSRSPNFLQILEDSYQPYVL